MEKKKVNCERRAWFSVLNIKHYDYMYSLVLIVFPVFLLLFFLIIDKANQKLPQKPGIDQSLFRLFGKLGSSDDDVSCLCDF